MPDRPSLHSGPGMRRLLGVLAQGSPAPEAVRAMLRSYRLDRPRQKESILDAA